MLKPLFLTLLITIMGIACTTTETPYGVQKSRVAYIPARIAVWPCMAWPHKARFYRQTVSNITDEELNKICETFDNFIIRGFKNQPYMRGLSPKVVKKLLEREGAGHMFNELETQWSTTQTEPCQDCKNPLEYYNRSLASQQTWLEWLSLLSRRVYNVDALLVPFVTYARKGQIDDRGMAKAYYRIGVNLLLIDTGDGRLIWAGGRDAEAFNRRLDARDPTEAVALPTFDRVESRLFLKEIWRDFPGRQNF